MSISVSRAGIFSGAAYDLLLEYTGYRTTLPLVHKLRILISDEEGYFEYAVDSAITNALEFGLLVKSMAPAVTSVEIKFDVGVWVLDKSDERVLGVFLKTLYGSAQHAALSITDVGLRHLSTIRLIPQLTSLALFCINSYDEHIALVRKCASTLRNLDVTLYDAKDLLHDANDNYIIYLELQHLVLTLSAGDGPINRVKTPGIIPFPRLKSLILDLPYMYGDDVLFRGNSATLEHLKIGVDIDTVAILNKYRVFENKHKVLRKVDISEDFINAGLSRVSKADLDIFLRNIMSAAQTVISNTARITSCLATAIQPNQDFKHIQLLDPQYSTLSLGQMLHLLRALPALTKFKSGINELGSELARISSDELPDYIKSTYENSGGKLHVWHMTYFNTARLYEAAEFVMLLALACPKLCRVMTMKGVVAQFNAKIVEALNGGPYSKYASQLNRLCNAFY
ncbi:hypothetical protein GGF42_000650 [Coemansia sp. RSA 2424]|nr:hypothetical protein GGF42_000650 [Coemansia sp. RSA 2424]